MSFILLPFAWIYNWITRLRNSAYDLGIFRETSFDIPIIGVGNLSIGGTGKTPMVEYLLKMLGTDINVAVLSRGYGRGTRGFRMVETFSTADDVGDEPLQMKGKFPMNAFAVCEDRVLGVQKLLDYSNDIQAIILDDAFQHRAIKPGLHILLTSYGHPYFNDHLLPAGRLRESHKGAGRAHIIVVTKTPVGIDEHQMKQFADRLNPRPNQMLCFASEEFGEMMHWQNREKRKFSFGTPVLIVTGIASANSLLNHVSGDLKFKVIRHIQHRDHYRFNSRDVRAMALFHDKYPQGIILTTEKDAQRLKSLLIEPGVQRLPIFTIGIHTRIFDTQVNAFNNKVHDFIRQGS